MQALNTPGNSGSTIPKPSQSGSLSTRVASLRLRPGYYAVKFGELPFTINTEGDVTLTMPATYYLSARPIMPGLNQIRTKHENSDI